MGTLRDDNLIATPTTEAQFLQDVMFAKRIGYAC
jgi:hypothetical protein